MMRWETRRRWLFCLLTAGWLLCLPGSRWGHAETETALSKEQQAIEEAARQYFDAEVRRDHERIYSLLAPSSAYRETHHYASYLAEAEASPVRIVTYRILGVSQIRDNHDRGRYPRVQKFAQVEVDMVLYYEDTKTHSEVNYSFTFIKEGGQWYKG